MPVDDASNSQRLPLVIQLGFAGSRHFIAPEVADDRKVAELQPRIEAFLVERLKSLRQELGMESRHFFCGVSSLAIGGDTIFSRACRTNGIPHRVLLPQTRDEFLNAIGSAGPDFSASQIDDAVKLLDGPHVIQERLVSDASNREGRFEDVNREITRVSDVLICVMRAHHHSSAGGSEGLIARAEQRGKPVLVVQVDTSGDAPVFQEEWKLPAVRGKAAAAVAEVFALPQEPATLKEVRLPLEAGVGAIGPQRYIDAVKGVSSAASAAMHRRFTRLAITIVGAHIVATVLAALALGFAPLHWHVVPILLGLELLMLILGLSAHWVLHRSRTSPRWAEARLLAEVTRSVQAIGALHVYPRHFFSLPFPEAIRPVLRTLNVLHLQFTRHDVTAWQTKRDKYIATRLEAPQLGQIDFYGRRMAVSRKRLAGLGVLFYLFWVTAFVSTSLKFAAHLGGGEELSEAMTAVLGTLAIVMPVLAAAALSLAAAHDLEAQGHTYQEMFEFLERQKEYLRAATSERDYADLVLETESRLLGETANWFSRRFFTGVA